MTDSSKKNDEQHVEDDKTGAGEEKLSRTGSMSGPKFFKHKLDTQIVSQNNNYFKDLTQQYHASVSASEAIEVAKEIVACAKETYTLRTKHSSTVQANEKAQVLLESVHTVLQNNEENLWKDRMAYIRNFTGQTTQVAVTVCQAHLRLATLSSSLGFTRRNAKGTYVNFESGVVLHVWHSCAEARRFVTCMQRGWDALFSFQIGMIAIPFSSLITFRGTLITVTALFSVQENSVPTPPEAPCLRANIVRLQAALDTHIWPILHQGSDGRYYCVDINFLAGLQLATSMPRDESIVVRSEAYPALPPNTPPLRKGPIMKEIITTQLISEVVTRMSAVLQSDAADFNTAMRRAHLATAMHKIGVNLQFLYKVYTAATKQGDTVLCELIEAEMVFRTVKDMLRADLRSSRSDTEHVAIDRVNRLMSLALARRSEVWERQVLPILREKYRAPPSFSVALSAQLMKNLAARLNASCGFLYDSDKMRFTQFRGIVQRITFFEVPTQLHALKRQLESHTQATPTNDDESETPLDGSATLKSPVTDKTSDEVSRKVWETQKAVAETLDASEPRTEAEACNALGLSWIIFVILKSSEKKALGELIAKKIEEAANNKVQYSFGCALFLARLHAMINLDREAMDNLTGPHLKWSKFHRNDMWYLAQLMAQTSQDDIDVLTRAMNMARHATWVDGSMSTWFYSLLVDIGSRANVVNSAMVVRKAMTLATRWVTWFDASNRRPLYLRAVRKMSGTLVSSGNTNACRLLKDVCFESLLVHEAAFTQRNAQVSVAVAHMAFVALNAHVEELAGRHSTHMKEFYALTLSMSSRKAAEVVTMCRGEAFTSLLGQISMGLSDVGEVGPAERAHFYSLAYFLPEEQVAPAEATAGESKEEEEAEGRVVLDKASRHVKHSMIIRLREMIDLLRNPRLVQQTFQFRTESLHRLGVGIVEQDARFATEMDEMIGREEAARKELAVDEKKDAEKYPSFIIVQITSNRLNREHKEEVAKQLDQCFVDYLQFCEMQEADIRANSGEEKERQFIEEESHKHYSQVRAIEEERARRWKMAFAAWIDREAHDRGKLETAWNEGLLIQLSAFNATSLICRISSEPSAVQRGNSSFTSGDSVTFAAARSATGWDPSAIPFDETDVRGAYSNWCATEDIVPLGTLIKQLPQRIVELQELRLPYSLLGLKHWHPLMQILRSATSLEKLDLTSCELRDEHISELVHLLSQRQHKRLQQLNLSQNPFVSFRGGRLVLKLPSLVPSLRRIDVQGTSMLPVHMNTISMFNAAQHHAAE